MKISKRARRDFDFYLNHALDTIGDEPITNVEYSDGGKSALECFYSRDTYGRTLSCREPELYKKILQSKASWNLQIKQWAEDIADGILLQQPELNEYTYTYPKWVFEATLNQATKLAKKKIGFAPRFSRLVTVYGNWWPPGMDWFDSVI